VEGKRTDTQTSPPQSTSRWFNAMGMVLTGCLAAIGVVISLYVITVIIRLTIGVWIEIAHL
jgi:hypothetical protein